MKDTVPSSSTRPEKPTLPPSRVLLERGFLGVKHFDSQEGLDQWKQLPWWKRLFS